MSPRFLFKMFAFAEAVTWAGLITAMVLRGTGLTDEAVRPAGGVHGFIFLAYCVVTVIVWVDQRWKPSTGILGLVLSIIPFATVPFDLWVDKRGLLAKTWRLGRGGEAPKGFIEHVLAWVIRHAVLSIVLFTVAVTAVFVGLLYLGPPV